MEPEWWEKAKQFDQRDKGIEVGKWRQMKSKGKTKRRGKDKEEGEREKEEEKPKGEEELSNEEKIIDGREKWRSEKKRSEEVRK